ncbi:MAG: class I SAM-dependent methyltransferase [Thermodesulfobacteriota bacterium]
MGRLRALLPGRWKFAWRYCSGNTPWDTGITPPEVMEFLRAVPPGKALDLGCGTGTNAMTLARHGWRVTGIDFTPAAIRAARRKAAEEGLEVEFRVGDVTDLRSLPGGYDYALDIGCLHSLPAEDRAAYAGGLFRLVRPGGWFMLYAWRTAGMADGAPGIAPGEAESLLREGFENVRETVGEESGRPSAWYWFRRR